MNLINLTPHAIRIVDPDGSITQIDPSGTVARISQSSVPADDLGAPFVRASFGFPVDLPDSQDGTIFIVSALVRTALPNRKDLASPGDLVRDDSGNVIGCRNLIVN